MTTPTAYEWQELDSRTSLTAPRPTPTPATSRWLARDQAQRLAAHYRAPAWRAEAAADVLCAAVLGVLGALALVHWLCGAAA